MPRETCYRCRRPAELCLCPRQQPMETRARIVLLMHPKEWRREKCATGRLACLNLAESEIIPGVNFDESPRYRSLLSDPGNSPILLYPGPEAFDLGAGGFPRELIGSRRLVVFLIDATWSCARTVYRETQSLREMPKLMLNPREPSRFRIKRQPRPGCLSTIEAVHELLLALEAAGLEDYPDKARLLEAFDAMQRVQIERAPAGIRGRW